MAKAKVRLTYSIELFVEGKNEDAIYDWMAETTPNGAARLAHQNGKYVTEDYGEEVICFVRDDSEVDVVIE